MRGEELFYIQDSRCYHGNAVVWWAKNGHGYTSNIYEAGRFTKNETAEIINSRESDIAWPCNYIDKNSAAKVTIIDMQYLNHKRKKTKMRKKLKQHE